jgi:hypothetical protein
LSFANTKSDHIHDFTNIRAVMKNMYGFIHSAFAAITIVMRESRWRGERERVRRRG